MTRLPTTDDTLAGRLVRRIGDARRAVHHRRATRALAHLDQHILNDIGLTRGGRPIGGRDA